MSSGRASACTVAAPAVKSYSLLVMWARADAANFWDRVCSPMAMLSPVGALRQFQLHDCISMTLISTIPALSEARHTALTLSYVLVSQVQVSGNAPSILAHT